MMNRVSGRIHLGARSRAAFFDPERTKVGNSEPNSMQDHGTGMSQLSEPTVGAWMDAEERKTPVIKLSLSGGSIRIQAPGSRTARRQAREHETEKPSIGHPLLPEIDQRRWEDLASFVEESVHICAQDAPIAFLRLGRGQF